MIAAVELLWRAAAESCFCVSGLISEELLCRLHGYGGMANDMANQERDMAQEKELLPNAS